MGGSDIAFLVLAHFLRGAGGGPFAKVFNGIANAATDLEKGGRTVRIINPQLFQVRLGDAKELSRGFCIDRKWFSHSIVHQLLRSGLIQLYDLASISSPVQPSNRWPMLGIGRNALQLMNIDLTLVKENFYILNDRLLDG